MVGGSSELRAHYNPGSGGASTDDATSAQIAAGIVLILLGSLLNSIQNVFEEKLLKGQGYGEVDPLEVVGWEGVFGTLLSAFVMLPICAHVGGQDNGVAEDTIDSLVMLGNSPVLIAMCAAFTLSLALMNNYSQVLSKNLSAVVRMLVSTCRVVVVWVIGIIIYSFDPDLGEAWDRWCWMQLAAFIVLVGGTFLYVTTRAAAPAEGEGETAVLVVATDAQEKGSSAR